MKSLFVFSLLVLITACGKGSDNSLKLRTHSSKVTVPDYFFLMNQYRISIGLKALAWSPMIEEVASEHSEWMSEINESFGHLGWRERCRVLRMELDGSRCGEIVARGQMTGSDVLLAWLSSPPHRRSLENPNWTHTGIGIAKDSQGKLYWTQIFLTLK